MARKGAILVPLLFQRGVMVMPFVKPENRGVPLLLLVLPGDLGRAVVLSSD